MTTEENDIELLDQYLQNTLAPAERVALEARLQNDEGLRNTLEDLKVLQAGIRESSRMQIKSQLVEIENKLPQPGKVISFRPWAVGIAATVVLAVVSILLWPRPTGPQELFAQYFEPYPNVIMPTVRGDLEPDTTLMAKAYRAYDSGDYEKAIRFFEQVGTKDEGVYLYLGNSYLAIDSTEKAIVCFEKVISDFDVFDEQAEWYLGMAYLKTGDLKEAKSLLSIIATKEGPYKIKAERVLPNLKP